MNISYGLGGTPYPGESARPSGVWVRCRRHDDGSASGSRISVCQRTPGRPEPENGSRSKVCNVNTIEI